jgi:hypothetical protein
MGDRERQRPEIHDHAKWRQLRQCVDIRLTACSFDIGQAEVDTEWDRESQSERRFGVPISVYQRSQVVECAATQGSARVGR